MKFEAFYANDGEQGRIADIQSALLDIPVGFTRVVFGWAVTRWSKDSFEVGTWGRATFGSETAAEGIASSTNGGANLVKCEFGRHDAVETEINVDIDHATVCVACTAEFFACRAELVREYREDR